MNDSPPFVLADDDFTITAGNVRYKWEQFALIDFTFFNSVAALR